MNIQKKVTNLELQKKRRISILLENKKLTHRYARRCVIVCARARVSAGTCISTCWQRLSFSAIKNIINYLINSIFPLFNCHKVNACQMQNSENILIISQMHFSTCTKMLLCTRCRLHTSYFRQKMRRFFTRTFIY